jgi:hypothetical protein
VVGLGNESQGALDMTLSVSGDIAGWVNWTDPDTFTLYPGQKLFVHFDIEFPASPPGEYSGDITASGIPDSETQAGGAAVPGNVALAIGVSIIVPAKLYLAAVYADGYGASAVVANYLNTTFNGSVECNLTGPGGWVETLDIPVRDVYINGTRQFSALWNSTLALGVEHTVRFRLHDMNETVLDEKTYGFRLPTPADITGVWHNPGVVYADYDATIYATVHDPQNGSTECTVHYTVDGGQERISTMDYGGGLYLFTIDNTSYQAGSYVEYWVTSFNDASGVNYSDESPRGSFRVYSSTAPDLVVDGMIFSPIDPQTDTMYDSNTTSIFVTVRNAGRGDVSDLVVEMFDYNNSISRETVASLVAGNSTVVMFEWATPAAGTHVLRFVADPDDAFAETDENNNYLSAEVSISETPEPPIMPASSPWDALPYIIIPIILFIIFLLIFLRRSRTINVTVAEISPFRNPKDGAMRWKYTCSYGDGTIIGTTRMTDVRAEEGTVIQVRPTGLHEREDGTLAWKDAGVMGIPDNQEPDTAENIRKMGQRVHKV